MKKKCLSLFIPHTHTHTHSILFSWSPLSLAEKIVVAMLVTLQVTLHTSMHCVVLSISISVCDSCFPFLGFSFLFFPELVPFPMGKMVL